MAQPKKRPFVSLKGLETGRVTSAGKPVYKYKGEEISEKSIDIEADGKTYVIPTVIDGKLYTEEAAVAKFFNKEVEPIKVLKENIKDRSKKLAKGGTAMKKQMELFEDGGLKEEGGMVDEVSGNDVPPGSTREEVRDDIPAQLSEGEFVFPADVVRYIGLEKLMRMRQEAKQGLKAMEAMGQMGNSDEATMPDDLPFDETDLDMEDELEYNEGGVVQAQQGTYVAPTVPTGTQQLGTTPMGAPPIPQQVGAGVSGTSFGTPYTPNLGQLYAPQTQPYAPVTYTQFLGPSAAGAPQTETVRYFNEATGQTRMIPHIVNPDGSRGATLYPVPEGFVIQEEAPKEEAKKTQVASAKVKPVETDDGSQDQEVREKEEAMYGPGAGRINLGGEIKPGTTVKTGTLFGGKGTSSLTKGSTQFGIAYDIPGSKNPFFAPGALAIQAFQAGIGNLPEGGTGKFTKDGFTITKPAKVTNAIIKNPMGPEAKELIKQHDKLKETFYRLQETWSDKLTNKEMRDMADTWSQTTVTKDNLISVENIGSKTLDSFVSAVNSASTGKDGGFDSSKFSNLPSGIQETYREAVTQKEDEQQTYGGYTGPTAGNLASLTPNNDDDGGFSDVSDDAGAPSDTSGDLGGEDVAKGSLITKRKASGKTKKKYMKRGGLASKK